ncbi:MAG: DEAD/DEAH box helicase [Cytophagales bacterium]|nr:DEAD/DEAH box helicase [Cytophagales bacterium]
MDFTSFGLDDRLVDGINAIGFTEATPIQQKAIPKIIDGKDIIASAQTGTGKTAAFLLPLIHKIISEGDSDTTIKALVIVPTRELAIQIDQQLEGLSYFTPISSIAIYGGNDGDSFSREKKAIVEGADFIIGTPGRLIAHLSMPYMELNKLKYLVLDEADRMLDMGFNQDITRIISHTPKERQTLLFSATMPPKIRALMDAVLTDHEEIKIAVSKPAEKVVQAAFSVYEDQKIPLMKFLLTRKKLSSVIVFSSTKEGAKELNRALQKLDLMSEGIHSDLDQEKREEILTAFKNKKLNILVATDILSRGIDIEDIELVVNYDVPNDGEDYIHRIGRTARAASQGAAFTLISEKEQTKFAKIEKLLGRDVIKAKLPAEIGEGPVYNPKPFRGGRRKPSRSRGKK